MLSPEYLQKIENLNPNKIYVENVRSLYGISSMEARLLCEMAVKEKLFIKQIGLVCPSPTCNGRIIATYSSFNEIPEQITCTICESDGNEPFVYNTSKLKKIEFYKQK